MQVDDRYHCVYFFFLKSQSSNQVSHIHWHLLHGCIVKRLNVAKNPLVLLGDEVDSNAFSAKTTTTTNSGDEDGRVKAKKRTSGCICAAPGGLPVNVVLSVCREVIVNDQGHLLDINPTSLKTAKNLSYTLVQNLKTWCSVSLVN